jgi:hypothetical protein
MLVWGEDKEMHIVCKRTDVATSSSTALGAVCLPIRLGTFGDQRLVVHRFDLIHRSVRFRPVVRNRVIPIKVSQSVRQIASLLLTIGGSPDRGFVSSRGLRG